MCISPSFGQSTNILMSSNAVWQFVTSYVQAYVATNPVNVQITNLSLGFNTNQFVVSGTNVSLNTNYLLGLISIPANVITQGMSIPVTFSNNVTVVSGYFRVTNGSANVVNIRNDGTIGATGSITNAGNIITALKTIAFGGFQYGSFPGLNTNFQTFSQRRSGGAYQTNSFDVSGGVITGMKN